MLCSLNEIEVMVQRSCRGSGMSWGLSYEAGRALRCLASGGVGFLSPLLSLLDRVDGEEARCFAPMSLQGGELCARRGKGDSGGLSPIAAGCGLSDGGSEVCGKRVVLRDVLSPVLLLGFLFRGRARWGGYVSVRRGEIVVVVGGEGFFVKGGSENKNGDEKGLRILEIVEIVRGDVVVEACEGAKKNLPGEDFYKVGNVMEGVEVAERDWRLLENYAARTYVVASAGSRERGAG